MLSYDDLPLPVIILRKDNGQVIKTNRIASKLFGLRTSSSLAIKKIRPNDLPSRSIKKEGYLRFERVLHRHVKGKTFRMTVLRKGLVWEGVNCWADFLEEVQSDHPIKTQILQSSLDAFISIDEDQRVCDWNPSAEKIFGWKKKEAVGLRLVDLIVPDAYKKRHLNGFNRFIKTGEQKILNRLVEISALHKKGYEFPVELTITPVLEDDRRLFYAFIRDISLRKKNEQTLRDGEEKLNRAQAIANIGSWEMYGKFSEIHWSDQFYRLHGLEPQSVKPSTKLRLAMTHAHDRQKLQKAIDQAVKKGKPYAIEKRIIRPDGEIRWILSEGEATIDAYGQRKVFGTLLDITERKKIQEALQGANAGLSETLIFGKMGSAELNLKTFNLNVSKELFHLLDVSVTEAQLVPLKDFLRTYIAPQYLPLIQHKIEEGMSANSDSKKVVEVEFQMITATNRIIWIEAKGIFKNDTALGILQDISARKESQAELVRMNEVIKNMHQRISNLTDTIPDGFLYEFWQNNDGSAYKINYISQGCEQLFEVSMEEAMKNADSLFSKIHPDDVGPFFSLVEEKRKVPGTFDIDYRIVMDDKRVKWVNGRANVRILADHSTIIEGIALDVTLKRNLEQTERDAKALLSQSENNLRAMLNASTDFTVFLDKHHHVLLANDQAKTAIHQLIGKELNVGDNFREVIPEIFREKFLDRFNRAFRGEIVDEEFEIGKKEISWLQLRFLPVKNLAEKIIGVSFSATDISKRKQAEDALLQSEANMKSVVENSDTAFVLLDTDFSVVSFNQLARKTIEQTSQRSVSIGDNALMYVSENRRPAIQQFLNTALAGIPSEYETPFNIQKHTKWLHVRFFPVFTNDNVTGVIFAMSDITLRKMSEAEISQSRERLKLISDNLPSVAIYQYEVLAGDWSGQYKYFSVGVEQITGISADKLLNDPNVFERQIHPDDYVDKQRLIKVAMDNMTVFNQDFRFRHRNSEWKWLRTRSQPSATPDGRIVWNGLIIDITEQKQAEATLKESELRFRTMADAAPVLIWMSGIDKLCYYFNKGWLEFTGRTLEQELGNGWAEGVHPDDLERCVSIYETTFDQRKDFVMEYRLKRNDGQYRWIVDHGTPRFSPSGEFAGYIGSCFDIHDLIETKKKLSENELRLRTILETEPECVKILNANGELQEMNKAGLDMIEAASLEQVVGQKITNLVDEPFRKEFQDLNQSVFNGNSGTLEFSMTGIKGTCRWLETHAVPMCDAAGKVISLLGVTRDVTQRKVVEQTLRESEERYRKLFELNPAPTWIFDLNSLGFLQVNNAALAHYGYTKEEFLGMTILDIRPEEERQLALATVDAFHENNEGEKSYDRFWKHKKKDGSLIDVEIMSTGFSFEGKQARLVTVNDVTQKIQSEKKLLNALSDKDVLIKEIHHRVKNNLQLISSILYIRLVGMKPGEVKIFLEETRQKIRSIALIHERLLQTGSVSQVDIADYLDKLILDLQMTSISNERKINLQANIESVPMNLDMAINCGLILNELVTNSVKHAFKNRTTGNIQITLTHKQDKFEFEIKDDGCGMPENIELGSGGFGMQLLDVFIKQLKASAEITRNNGTGFCLVFLDTAN